MPVIKHQEARTRGARPFSFQDLEAQAQKYLDQVRQQARQILQDAQRQVATQRAQLEAQIRQELQQQFAQQVAQEVQTQVAQRIQSLLPALEQTVEELRLARGQWLQHWQQNALQLVVAVAEKVIRQQLQHQPQIALTWLQEALELAAGSPQVQVRMHPQDLDSLGQEAQRLAQTILPSAQVQFTADDALEPGEVVVRTAWGEVDQRLQTQLQRIAEELR